MSRQVKLFFATSVDGFIAGPSGELDWLIEDQDYGYEEFISNVDTLIMGRRTYDMIANFAEWPYGDRKIYVLSTRESNPDDDRVTFSNYPVEQFIEGLICQPGKDIWIVGGMAIIDAAFCHDLIDEISLNIHPVALGAGVPMFPNGDRRIHLSLISHHLFEKGLISVRYRVERSETTDKNLLPLIGLKWGKVQKNACVAN